MSSGDLFCPISNPKPKAIQFTVIQQRKTYSLRHLKSWSQQMFVILLNWFIRTLAEMINWLIAASQHRWTVTWHIFKNCLLNAFSWSEWVTEQMLQKHVQVEVKLGEFCAESFSLSCDIPSPLAGQQWPVIGWLCHLGHIFPVSNTCPPTSTHYLPHLVWTSLNEQISSWSEDLAFVQQLDSFCRHDKSVLFGHICGLTLCS